MGWLFARVVLVVCTPVAAAWLIGDLTTEASKQAGAQGATLTYGMHPAVLEPVVGIAACAAVVGAFVYLAWGTATDRDDPNWWLVMVPLIVVGVVLAFGWRVFTMGDIGANIGAGLVVMFGGPFVLVCLTGAAIAALYTVTTGRRVTDE